MEERSLQRFVWIFLVCVVSVSVFQITTSCKPGVSENIYIRMFTSWTPLYCLLRFKVIFTHAGAVEITPENIVGKEGQNTAITCCFSVITFPTWLIYIFSDHHKL